MRHSEFHRLLAEVFGDRGQALAADLVLADLGERTALSALEQGDEPRRVWWALCDAVGVAEADRFGKRKPGRR